ncbi:hypothetical protein CKAH01_13005 [Colletotrichum kahawae]|uniref:Uncharacterized protein n=1 Tax=Colletotrichum kahawae TaxID=34407 RepID=A0AAD9YR18_COLKA|nr:hypothetical protein CKAH01_13005 [Colletotrichum kahawae]
MDSITGTLWGERRGAATSQAASQSQATGGGGSEHVTSPCQRWRTGRRRFDRKQIWGLRIDLVRRHRGRGRGPKHALLMGD